MKLGATFRVRRRTHRAAEFLRTHARRSTLCHAISAVLFSSLALTALYLSKRPEVAQEIRLDQGMISAKGRSAAFYTMRMPTTSMCEPQLHTEYWVGELIRPVSSEPLSGPNGTSAEGASAEAAEAAAGTVQMTRPYCAATHAPSRPGAICGAGVAWSTGAASTATRWWWRLIANVCSGGRDWRTSCQRSPGWIPPSGGPRGASLTGTSQCVQHLISGHHGS